MAEPFVAEIRIFAGNFAPTGWAACDGQLMPISQNTALFSLLGTTYGGDGRSTFALPDLQGRAPMQPGQGPGRPDRQLGESGGADSVTLGDVAMPAHTHAFFASSAVAATKDPQGNLFARSNEDAYAQSGTLFTMSTQVLSESGGGQPHNNLQPYLVLNFIIALQGVFPPRS